MTDRKRQIRDAIEHCFWRPLTADAEDLAEDAVQLADHVAVKVEEHKERRRAINAPAPALGPVPSSAPRVPLLPESVASVGPGPRGAIVRGRR